MCALLALAPGRVAAQAVEGGESDWVEYRDAYRQMIWFEKYSKPKQFLLSHYRVRPRDKNASLDGLRLTLNSKAGTLNLALDPLGRAVFPFSKAAYDDNAALTLNRKAGQFRFEGWISIATRADGVYEAADLRLACEQLLAYLRYVGDSGVGGRSCVGVQFSYAHNDGEAEVRLRRADHGQTALPAREGPAFPGDVVGKLRVFVYRFAAMPEGGQVVTRNTPLAIAALLE
ncbi:hypothetical protein H7U20_16180 [Rugamonas sp. CCM 8940]|nr:hypothetical protein [Rugamonas sp. CCM 8940]